MPESDSVTTLSSRQAFPHTELRCRDTSHWDGFCIDAALFWSSAAKSIQPDCKACTHVLLNMCAHCIPRTFPSLVLSLIHIHAYTQGQAAMGGGNARNAPNPGLVFWLVPDFMPSPPGSVARPPCARPTGSNTRPGQPSSSSRPIINQQAALQLTSLPPSSHQYRGLSETQRKNIQPYTAACSLGCSGRLLEEEVLMISISLLTALCLNTLNILCIQAFWIPWLSFNMLRSIYNYS